MLPGQRQTDNRSLHVKAASSISPRRSHPISLPFLPSMEGCGSNQLILLIFSKFQLALRLLIHSISFSVAPTCPTKVSTGSQKKPIDLDCNENRPIKPLSSPRNVSAIVYTRQNSTMRYALSTLTLIALTSSYVTALGINCRGSSNCGFFVIPDNPGQNVANALRQKIVAQVSDSHQYQNGDHIACVQGEVRIGQFTAYGSICAFLQGTGGIPGNEIKTLAQRIVEHGCKGCGSVPVYFDKGDNDVNSHGELTFNYVS